MQSKIGVVTISTASTTTYTVTVAAKAGGGGNAFSGTTVQEFGVGGIRVPNVV